VQTLNDPILGWKWDSPQAHEMAYVGMLLWAEILFLMPVAVYGAWALWPTSAKKGTTGPQELLFLVWCCEMFFSTAICINNVFWWDPVAYPADVKRTFVLTYGAWVVVRKLHPMRASLPGGLALLTTRSSFHGLRHVYPHPSTLPRC
jgi:hypothetical protein